MNKAIFFDRDGVINELIFNPKTQEYESPHEPADLKLIPGVIEVMKTFQDHGYNIFIISNQPSFAKGKTTLEKIQTIQENVQELLEKAGVYVKKAYYCYHHPDGIIPEYSGICECRKPNPFFIKKAEKEYNIDIASSWIIGDRDTDIECGKNAHIKTILIRNEHSRKKWGHSSPDYSIDLLSESLDIILKSNI